MLRSQNRGTSCDKLFKSIDHVIESMRWQEKKKREREIAARMRVTLGSQPPLCLKCFSLSREHKQIKEEAELLR